MKTLAKVDDSVFELAATAWGITDATRFVLFSFRRCAYAIVTHVLTIALHAEFEICVSVELCEHVSSNTAFTMETIDILTDDAFENVPILQLNQSHMRYRWPSLLDGHLERHAVGAGKLLASKLHVLLVFLSQSGLLPASWASREGRAIA